MKALKGIRLAKVDCDFLRFLKMNIILEKKYTPAPIANGCTDRILKVDLANLKISIDSVSVKFRGKYIGGRGYALKLIWDETTELTRYDSPENLLVFAGGPLCNEPRFPGSGKFIVGTISPLTDTFVDSNVGGYFSPILKACGFDAIAISGISEHPVVLVIDDDRGNISINLAPPFNEEVMEGSISYGSALLNSYTNNRLHKNIAAVTTGIGAENTRLGLINSHFFDSQRKRLRIKQAGRGGTGTVMRLKGLMGVIVHSSQTRKKGNNAADPEKVKEVGTALSKVIKSEDPKQLFMQSCGTAVLVEFMNRFHLLPINNYQYGQDPKANEVFSNVFLKDYLKKKRADGCYFGCNLACAKGAEDVTITRGPYTGRTIGIDGPEYETVAAVTCLGIFDPQFTMEFNWYCDEFGLDTISTGVSMAFIIECYQRGYLNKIDVGYDLKWGNIESIERLFFDTITATGIGEVCGEGVHRSKKWIAKNYSDRSELSYSQALSEISRFAMELKGLEFSLYIPKESLAQQGGYGFSLKGPQHDEAWLIFLDQVHKELSGFKLKTEALIWFPLIRTWFNAVGLCKLPWIDVRHPEAENTAQPAQNMPTFNIYIQYLNATMGSRKTIQDVLVDSERLHLLQKLINLRQGKGTREHDMIPLRAMGPAFPDEYQRREAHYDQWLSDQMGEGEILPESLQDRHRLLIKFRLKAYDMLCDSVYSARGYDSNAVPLSETVKKFGLYDEQARALLAMHSLKN